MADLGIACSALTAIGPGWPLVSRRKGALRLAKARWRQYCDLWAAHGWTHTRLLPIVGWQGKTLDDTVTPYIGRKVGNGFDESYRDLIVDMATVARKAGLVFWFELSDQCQADEPWSPYGSGQWKMPLSVWVDWLEWIVPPLKDEGAVFGQGNELYKDAQPVWKKLNRTLKRLGVVPISIGCHRMPWPVVEAASVEATIKSRKDAVKVFGPPACGILTAAHGIDGIPEAQAADGRWGSAPVYYSDDGVFNGEPAGNCDVEDYVPPGQPPRKRYRPLPGVQADVIGWLCDHAARGSMYEHCWNTQNIDCQAAVLAAIKGAMR